jgi:hypothetical protein
MISARTKAALAAAKVRGVKLGGFRGRAGTPAECAIARAERTKQADAHARALAPILVRLGSQRHPAPSTASARSHERRRADTQRPWHLDGRCCGAVRKRLTPSAHS